MTTTPQSVRIEIWQYTYARASLIEARETAILMLANPKLPVALQQACTYQIVVAYARPFTKCQVTDSKRMALLHDDLVPRAFRAIHSQHLELRDQAIGHKDAGAYPGTPLNRVIVSVDKDGVECKTVSPYTILPLVLQQTVELCNVLIAFCESKAKSHDNHFMNLKEGTYVLNLEPPPAAWLVKQ